MAERARVSVLVCALASACTVSGTVGIVALEGEGTEETSAGHDTESSERLDVSSNPIVCTLDEERTGESPCVQEGPPDAFVPVELWSWHGFGADTDSFVTPLVANLTDDNDDGRIDGCDVPDLVVVAGPPRRPGRAHPSEPAHIYVLDGASGSIHLRIEQAVSPAYTPALGDVDGDGSIDIVAVLDESEEDEVFVGRIVAFSREGELLFEGDRAFEGDGFGSVSLADLEGDGNVWIMVDRVVARGPSIAIELPEPVGGIVPFAADLDLDGVQEVVWGREARRPDGTVSYATDLRHGYAQLGDFDDDPNPEIVLTNGDGLTLIDHDGTILVRDQRPLPGVAAGPGWRRPAALHDLDGDRMPELVMGVGDQFAAFRISRQERTFTLMWNVPIADAGGSGGATAFDFLGDGRAEAMLADERALHMIDLEGRDVLQIERSGATLQAYPVVADIDNDGSAEIVVVSNALDGVERSPTIRVLGEEHGRWVQARRIWNQHAYHVTNVEESGRIPSSPVRGWRRLNTFRTNAQIEDGVVCVPPVP